MIIRHIRAICVLLTVFLASCAFTENRLQLAERLSHQSTENYHRAIKEYQTVLQVTSDKSVQEKLGTLYFEHKDYDLAAENLKDSGQAASQRMLAISYYHLGRYTQALEVFNRLGEQDDARFMYFYGLTCERLNLYDQAKGIFLKIKSSPFLELSQKRIKEIDSHVVTSFQDPQVMELLRNSPAQEQYPQAGAVIMLVDEKVQITPDNTAVAESHYIIKILNERGRKFAEVDIDYDSTYETAEIIFARTIKPSGEVVNVGTKHIRDVSRYLDFPLYSNARALIISMPEVTDAAIIEYKVRVKRNKLIADKEFNLAYTLQEDEPILLANLSLIVPSNREVHLVVLNQKFNTFEAEMNPRITQEKENKIYRWEFKNIPQVIPEPMMPPLSEITPAFIVSSFKSWEEVYQWWWKLAEDKVDINTEMRALVKRLIEGKESKEEKARAVYEWCIKNIRYVGIEYGQAGYEPHRATEIFANKYGDCKDQSILLISLLQEAGIEAYPVLIGTKGAFTLEENLPTVLFNHCIAVTRLDDQLVFMDPTGETVSFKDLPTADQDRKVLVFFKDGGKIVSTPDFPASHNKLVRKTEIKINPDETIIAQRKIYTHGFYDQGQRWKFKYTRPVLIEESLKEAVNSIVPGGKLQEYKIENVEDMDKPVKLAYKFSGPNYLIRAGKARVILGGSVNVSLVAKDKRNYDIDFNVLDIDESVTTIALPSTLTLGFLPEPVSLNTPWLDLTQNYTFKDNKIIITSQNVMKKKKVTSEEYPAFKKVMEDWAEQAKQCIILEETLSSGKRR